MKKTAVGMSAFKPVLCENIRNILGKDGVAVGAVLGAGDMNPHILVLNITVD